MSDLAERSSTTSQVRMKWFGSRRLAGDSAHVEVARPIPAEELHSGPMSVATPGVMAVSRPACMSRARVERAVQTWI